MGRFQIKKFSPDGRKELSPQFESPDAADAFVQVEKDDTFDHAEIWEDGRRVGCAHRKGRGKATYWLLDGHGHPEPD